MSVPKEHRVPEFAKFSPRRAPRVPLIERGLVVREAAEVDLGSVAELTARREGVDPEATIERLSAAFGRPDSRLVVAALDGRVIGFGRSSLLRPPPEAPAHCIPEGWYLGGLVVHPEFRRRGAGTEITRHRLDELFRETQRVHYFATLVNRASIALHARLGFRELTRDLWAPGVSFTGGVGALFGLERDDYEGIDPGRRAAF